MITTPISVDVFSSELLPGERVHWTGSPNASVIFHREDLATVPFSLLWGGFAIFWLLGASGIWDVFANKPNDTFHWFGIIWGTPFVLVGQYLIWGRFIHTAWKKRRTYYALTDRRALILYYAFRARNVESAYFSNLDRVEKRVRPDGIGSIAFGGPVQSDWQLRPKGSRSTPAAPTFADIDDADSVYQLAMRLQESAQKTNVWS